MRYSPSLPLAWVNCGAPDGVRYEEFFIGDIAYEDSVVILTLMGEDNKGDQNPTLQDEAIFLASRASFPWGDVDLEDQPF